MRQAGEELVPAFGAVAQPAGEVAVLPRRRVWRSVLREEAAWRPTRHRGRPHGRR
jgi:hypothetical protein